MLRPTLLALVSLGFYDLALAFYPLIPEYRCIYSHTCDAEGKGVNVAVKIEQRQPNTDIPLEVQVHKLAERLTQKYQKRGKNTHNVVTAATPTYPDSAGIDQDGTDYSYFAQVQLGSANTPLYMLLDSGAGQSWVMGPDCDSEACSNHNSFGDSDSTTFKEAEGSWSVQYGSGSCSGSYGNDTLKLAGFTIPVTLGIANVTSNDFNNFPMDGILGLSRATGEYPNFIQSLVATGDLKKNMFAMSLNRDSDGPNTGEITFGSTDPAKFTGDIDYSPVATNGQSDWAIAMDGMGFNGKDAGITGKLAYIDTGTSYIFGPSAEVAQFHALVPGAATTDNYTYTVPCTTTTPLTFTFSGVTYNVLAEDWVSPMANGVCTSNVFGDDIVPNQWLLGDTFIKNVYVVFDVDGDRVGFALKPGSQAATSSGTSSATGGPLSSTASSSATAPADTTSSSSFTYSDIKPTGSQSASSATGTSKASPTTSESGTSSTNGKQTPTGNAAAESSSSASPTDSTDSTKKSASSHLDITLSTILLTASAFLVLSY